jgi:hypothetical protein
MDYQSFGDCQKRLIGITLTENLATGPTGELEPSKARARVSLAHSAPDHLPKLPEFITPGNMQNFRIFQWLKSGVCVAIATPIHSGKELRL